MTAIADGSPQGGDATAAPSRSDDSASRRDRPMTGPVEGDALADELERLHSAATPGPWKFVSYCGTDVIGSGDNPRGKIVFQPNDEVEIGWNTDRLGPGTMEANAAMIVALRNNLPTILTTLRTSIPAPYAEDDGYKGPFYEIADMLDIPAQAISPKRVWEEQMRPAIVAALKASAPVAEGEVERARLDDFKTAYDLRHGLCQHGCGPLDCPACGPLANRLLAAMPAANRTPSPEQEADHG